MWWSLGFVLVLAALAAAIGLLLVVRVERSRGAAT